MQTDKRMQRWRLLEEIPERMEIRARLRTRESPRAADGLRRESEWNYYFRVSKIWSAERPGGLVIGRRIQFRPWE